MALVIFSVRPGESVSRRAWEPAAGRVVPWDSRRRHPRTPCCRRRWQCSARRALDAGSEASSRARSDAVTADARPHRPPPPPPPPPRPNFADTEPSARRAERTRWRRASRDVGETAACRRIARAARFPAERKGGSVARSRTERRAVSGRAVGDDGGRGATSRAGHSPALSERRRYDRLAVSVLIALFLGRPVAAESEVFTCARHPERTARCGLPPPLPPPERRAS